jgi:hypothetical protein
VLGKHYFVVVVVAAAALVVALPFVIWLCVHTCICEVLPWSPNSDKQ